MTVPLILLAIPTVLLGPRHRAAAGRLARSSTGWSPIFHPAEETLGIHLPEYELFGIDGVLILVSVAVATLGIGIGIWLFGFFRRRGPARDRASA